MDPGAAESLRRTGFLGRHFSGSDQHGSVSMPVVGLDKAALPVHFQGRLRESGRRPEGQPLLWPHGPCHFRGTT